jgi:hypothetical protein
MKKIRLHLKRIALLLIFLMTLQSCSVYYSKTASVDEALLSDNKVKVITTTNDIYKFKKLQSENDQIYGVIKKRSTKGENLWDQGLLEDYDAKYGKLLLEEISINGIHLKNKGASTAITVAIPVVIVGVVVGIGVYSANNISLDMEFGFED